MTYFGIDSDRYGGWDEAEKEAELKLADIPPGRESRDENEDDD